MQDWPTPTLSPYRRLTMAQTAWFAFRVALVVGVVTLLVISLARAEKPFIDEQCLESYSCKYDSKTTHTVYDLMLFDEPISKPYSDMTAEECNALAASLTIPVYCRPRLVEREES